ncbi:amidohydrolase [Ancylobacter sp. MQZ15Z-1]|uniref:Amidohydrolase n=1 Tax=Ancylobacter mangrovi TaxID=2972472 RepID=A0A9X2PFP8_9HYPH|nr:amidohydrolase family protein [Ancylobacter mangrovi]MCS0494627.1 amidohydrolase [Ancylobacter mangrovi]
MNVVGKIDATKGKGVGNRLAVADCDIHPTVNGYRDLYPYLEKRWQTHLQTYGAKVRHGYQRGAAYPKGQPDAKRRDAWPEGGGLAGSDLRLLQTQHLDANNVELGVLNPLTFCGYGLLNSDLSAALATAANEWQKNDFTRRDPRLKASIVVPYEDGPAAAREIERCAAEDDFVQVLLLSRTAEPLGKRNYWPIFEAAAAANLPVGVHAFGYGGAPVTGSGWPSYYIEEMFGHSPSCQALLASMIFEGVFERYPNFKLVLIEAGCAWLPAFTWRLDKHWERLRSEVPHVKRPPSEYIRQQVWITTQPIEEPEPRSHLVDVIDWIGWDRLLFASDYPHWDFDDPAVAFPIDIPLDLRQQFLLTNAKALYGVQ